MVAHSDKRSELRYVGKRIPRVDAPERVTGQAAYGADIHLPGMLYGKAVRSPHPHARIKKIDTNKSQTVPGVKGIITAADLPAVEQAGVSFGGELMIALEHLRQFTLARDKVLFDGHTVAVVAATTPEAAEYAAELVDVEYEILPPVETVLEAMESGAPLLHDNLYTVTLGQRPTIPSNIAMITESSRGNVEKAFQESDVVLENTYETKMVHQGYIEPQAATARVEADGHVTVWTCTQGTYNVQRQLSALLEIPQDKLNIVPMEIGGGFGGKIYTILEPLVIMLAQKTHRPVKMVLTRAEVFRATGPGSPAYMTVKTAANRDGKLTACYAKIVLDAGAFPGSPTAGASLVSFGPYNVDNLCIEAYDVVTNKPRVQAYRAPGGTQVGFAVESHMDQMAEVLGIGALDFRKINAVREGDLMTNDRPYSRIGLKDVLERVETHPAWTEPLEGTGRGRGLAVAFWLGTGPTSSVLVTIHSDGTVTHQSGQVDLTGTRTTMQQVTAEELQVPIEYVSVRVTDTNSSPYTDLSAGSRTTRALGTATQYGCKDALNQMKGHAANQLNVDISDVEYADRRFWVRNDSGRSMSWEDVAKASVRRHSGPVVGKGAVTRLQNAQAFAAHIADVEVDSETGKVKVLRYTAFQDVGKALNPTQVEGQMQGGAFQGIGWALTESYCYVDGKLTNPNLLDYRIPTALDLPMIDTEIIEVPISDDAYGARGVGEVPIVPPAAAIANAIYWAVGVRMRNLPMTPEAVFWAIQEKSGEETMRVVETS